MKSILLYVLGPSYRGARIRVILQGMFGGLLIFGIFTSLHLIPASEATAIFFMTPTFSFLFSYFLLKEHYTILRIFVSILSVSGVLLVVRPKLIFEVENEKLSFNTNASETFFDLGESSNHIYSPFISTNSSTLNVTGLTGDEKNLLPTELALGYSSAFLVPISIAVISILSRQLAQISVETLNVPLLMIWQGIGLILIGIVSYFAFNDANHNEDEISHWWADAIGIFSFGLMGNIFFALSTKFMIPSLINVIRCNEIVLMCVIQMMLSKSEDETIIHLEHGFGIFFLFLSGIVICIESKITAFFSKNCKFNIFQMIPK